MRLNLLVGFKPAIATTTSIGPIPEPLITFALGPNESKKIYYTPKLGAMTSIMEEIQNLIKNK